MTYDAALFPDLPEPCNTGCGCPLHEWLGSQYNKRDGLLARVRALKGERDSEFAQKRGAENAGIELGKERDALRAALDEIRVSCEGGIDRLLPEDRFTIAQNALAAPAGAVKAANKSHGGGVEPEPHGLRSSTAAEQPDREPSAERGREAYEYWKDVPGFKEWWAARPEPAPACPGVDMDGDESHLPPSMRARGHCPACPSRRDE